MYPIDFCVPLVYIASQAAANIKNIEQSPQNILNMLKYSQDTLDIVDIQTQKVYGITIPEVIEKFESAKTEAENAKKKIRNTVVRCYSILNMSIDQITQATDLPQQDIYHILKAENLIA